MTSLLRQYVEARCRARELLEADGRVFYFPATPSIANRLPFALPDGRERWLKPVGHRSVLQRGQFERVRYHLGRQATRAHAVRQAAHETKPGLYFRASLPNDGPKDIYGELAGEGCGALRKRSLKLLFGNTEVDLRFAHKAPPAPSLSSIATPAPTRRSPSEN